MDIGGFQWKGYKIQKLEHPPQDGQNVADEDSPSYHDEDLPKTRKEATPTKIAPLPITNPQIIEIREDGSMTFPEEWSAEVKALCKISSCDLCSVNFTSIKHASDHYVGSLHKKKMKFWSIGQVNRQRGVDTNLYCKYCDVHLSSSITANDHYKGKKHQSTMRKSLTSDTSTISHNGSGIQDESDGRFQIGEKFLATPQPPACSPQPKSNKFQCALCNIFCTDQNALDAHLAGSKHRKKAFGEKTFQSTESGNESLPLPFPIEEATNKLKVLLNEMDMTELMKRILAVDLQCHDCDAQFNDIVELVEHLKSPEHVFTWCKKNNAFTLSDLVPAKESWE